MIAGLHAGGKFVLTLLEMPSCSLEDVVNLMPAIGPCVQRQLSQIVLATLKCTKPMVVEYVACSIDGQGRVYARQAGAQQLPKEVRMLVYGRTHKEVDMTGAHYEILRRLARSSTLPPISILRERLGQLWLQSGVEHLDDEAKRFPIRIINAGVADTLPRASTLGLVIPPDIEAISYEVAAVRDSVTSTVLAQFRPQLQCTGANKHFFALEFLENGFMIAFLRELRKRDRCASLIWLHDGLWVQKELSDALIRSAEQIAAREVFPALSEWPSLFRIRDLRDQYVALYRAVPCHSGGYLFPPPPGFSSRRPKPRFGRKRVGPGLATTFHARMSKRGRHQAQPSWLGSWTGGEVTRPLIHYGALCRLRATVLG